MMRSPQSTASSTTPMSPYTGTLGNALEKTAIRSGSTSHTPMVSIFRPSCSTAICPEPMPEQTEKSDSRSPRAIAGFEVAEAAAASTRTREPNVPKRCTRSHSSPCPYREAKVPCASTDSKITCPFSLVRTFSFSASPSSGMDGSATGDLLR